ncbi:hypothetical protein QVD17_11062 [Tagetes erecta]|uniref:Uncharacterized protein n=1 Tax=Tagetes erecta TaxID=13708 RepID=A0AAD8L2C1_TARER|nr:hypothetical protein QVD17_11062 [Tagetes erecta]
MTTIAYPFNNHRSSFHCLLVLFFADNHLQSFKTTNSKRIQVQDHQIDFKIYPPPSLLFHTRHLRVRNPSSFILTETVKWCSSVATIVHHRDFGAEILNLKTNLIQETDSNLNLCAISASSSITVVPL